MESGKATLILAMALLLSLLLFGIGLFGISFGEERRTPVLDMQEATRIVLTQFPNARILEIGLETEDGKLVYEVELVTIDGQKKEGYINAADGEIEKIRND